MHPGVPALGGAAPPHRSLPPIKWCFQTFNNHVDLAAQVHRPIVCGKPLLLMLVGRHSALAGRLAGEQWGPRTGCPARGCIYGLPGAPTLATFRSLRFWLMGEPVVMSVSPEGGFSGHLWVKGGALSPTPAAPEESATAAAPGEARPSRFPDRALCQGSRLALPHAGHSHGLEPSSQTMVCTGAAWGAHRAH